MLNPPGKFSHHKFLVQLSSIDLWSNLIQVANFLDFKLTMEKNADLLHCYNKTLYKASDLFFDFPVQIAYQGYTSISSIAFKIIFSLQVLLPSTEKKILKKKKCIWQAFLSVFGKRKIIVLVLCTCIEILEKKIGITYPLFSVFKIKIVQVGIQLYI